MKQHKAFITSETDVTSIRIENSHLLFRGIRDPTHIAFISKSMPNGGNLTESENREGEKWRSLRRIVVHFIAMWWLCQIDGENSESVAKCWGFMFRLSVFAIERWPNLIYIYISITTSWITLIYFFLLSLLYEAGCVWLGCWCCRSRIVKWRRLFEASLTDAHSCDDEYEYRVFVIFFLCFVMEGLGWEESQCDKYRCHTKNTVSFTHYGIWWVGNIYIYICEKWIMAWVWVFLVYRMI